jgi:pilus assembly protein CpaF
MGIFGKKDKETDGNLGSTETNISESERLAEIKRETEEKAPKAAFKKDKKKKKVKGEFSESEDTKNIHEIERVFIRFNELLEKVQQYMSEKYAVELYDTEKKDMMKRLIQQYMKDNNFYVPNMTLGDVADKLYIEMAEYSILTPWLHRADIEEINVNSWNDIEIIPARGAPFKLDEHFRNADHAVDVIKRLLHNNKITFDSSKPIATGFLGANIRITAGHTDICGKERGVCGSIRIVNPAKISHTQFVSMDTCTEEEYDFLTTCFVHGVSQVYAGETGSGKTTFMADIMSNYPDNKRLITLEKSVREFDLVKYDEKGNVVNNVIHLVTKETDDPSKDVTLEKLLTMCLTMHPNAICVAEMKNEEAWQAQEAARTGHTVLTTTHASSTHGIYNRLATLCLQAYSQVPFGIILSLVSEAFPLAIYLKQLDDGSRRLMEIAECIFNREKNDYDTRTLYRYDIISEERAADGSVLKIHGQHVKVNPPSENLMKRLRDNGVPKDKLEIYGKVR